LPFSAVFLGFALPSLGAGLLGDHSFVQFLNKHIVNDMTELHSKVIEDARHEWWVRHYATATFAEGVVTKHLL
jgi:hypothetical protein